MTDAPLWRRGVAGWQPADPEAHALFEAFKVGEVVRFKPAKMRNAKFHRKYWALINLCVKNTEGWTAESLSDYIKIKTGHFTPFVLPVAPDVIVRKPKSISFSAMDDIQFGLFFETAINAMIRWVVPHISAEELRNAVELELAMS